MTDALVKTFEKENAAAAKQTWETAGVLLRADAKGVQRSAPVNISHRPIESICGVDARGADQRWFLNAVVHGRSAIIYIDVQSVVDASDAAAGCYHSVVQSVGGGTSWMMVVQIASRLSLCAS